MTIAILPRSAPRAGIAIYTPKREHQRYIDDCEAFLSATAPFFAHILYSEMKVVCTKAVPWAATDAHYIYLNPEGMRAEGWGIEEGGFVIAHEIMHYVFGDLLVAIKWREDKVVFTGTRTLPYDAGQMNRAMDYRINAGLIEGKIGKFPTIGCYDPSLSAKGMEDCVVIYDKLHQKGSGGGGTQFDEHLEPGPADQEREKRIGEHRREELIHGAIQAQNASGMGDLPSMIRRLVDEVLNPKVKWGDKLKATMARSAGKPRLDWRSLDRKMISRPVGGRIAFARRSKYGCGTIVVGWDTSGSTHKHTSAFFGEMAGIVAELNPERLIVMRCDAKVHAVDELAKPGDLNGLKATINADPDGIGGGGGTKFTPVFAEIEKRNIKPDMVCYLTDLMGSFPDRAPNYPVIWATVKKGKPPFGQVVDVEL
jgi:predicted metal-dependent peptidase